MKRVKFHSINDMANGYFLRKAESVMKEYEDGKEILDINDILELYNIKKII